MAKLNCYVVVRDSNLLSHTFGPDDDVPDWAVKKITNPTVWAADPTANDANSPDDGSDQTEGTGEAQGAGETEGSDGTESTQETEGAEEAGDDHADGNEETQSSGDAESAQVADGDEEAQPAEGAAVPIPPRGGPKATVEAWAGYAKAQIAARGMQIEIPSDASRKDIIEALAAADIPTKE